MYSIYMDPCSTESSFPTDGAPAHGPHRELLPRSQLPTGLLSFECGNQSEFGNGDVRLSNPVPCRAPATGTDIAPPTLPDLRWACWPGLESWTEETLHLLLISARVVPRAGTALLLLRRTRHLPARRRAPAAPWGAAVVRP